MRVDLHTHTWFSPDGMMSPERLIDLAKKRGLNALAITDHNRLTRVEKADFPIIPGEEIKTTKGEVLGLFLTEEIPTKLSPEETFDRIREQGGIIVIPHPFDRFRRKTALLLNGVEPPKNALIEVLNARYISITFYREALMFARRMGIPAVGASDAHTPIEVGRAWTEVPGFSDIDELYRYLRRGRTKPGGSLSPPWVHLTVPVLRVMHFLHTLP